MFLIIQSLNSEMRIEIRSKERPRSSGEKVDFKYFESKAEEIELSKEKIAQRKEFLQTPVKHSTSSEALSIRGSCKRLGKDEYPEQVDMQSVPQSTKT